MSDILIRGMEMPEDGSCFQIVIDDDGNVYPTVEKCIMKIGSIATAVPVPSQTNADHIRAMTDEELAGFIGGDPMHDICPSDCFEDPDRPCKVCVLKWLKQEGE